MQYKWVALTVTTVGVLMSGVNSRIVIVGLPTIGHQTGASLSELIWITQAYLLASTVAIPLIGRVTDIVGRVKIYNIGFLIFTVGSALTSISFSPYEIIASRLVQGVGAAMLTANSTAILTDASPKNELGTMLGMNQIAWRAGAVAGLTLSGIILQFADWRALFYINIPIGIFGTLWAHKRLKEISVKDPVHKMDWMGFSTLSSSLALLLLAMTLLSYGLSGLFFGLTLLAGGFVLLVTFVIIELRESAPLLDLKLFKIREFTAASLAQILYGFVFSGTILMLSFYLQISLGESPLVAGLSIIPMDVAFLVVGPLSGRLSDKHGTRLLSSVGLGLLSVALITLSVVANTAGSYLPILLSLVLLGIGNGIFTSPNASAIMRSVPPHRRGVASGFRATAFNATATASYGIVILVMTVVIPYKTFSALIGGGGGIVSVIAKMQFVQGFKLAMLVLAIISAVAIIPSALRGKEYEILEKTPPRPSPEEGSASE
jgi:EmrB/QacA subfamily drug resistance transporter